MRQTNQSVDTKTDVLAGRSAWTSGCRGPNVGADVHGLIRKPAGIALRSTNYGHVLNSVVEISVGA